MARPDFPLSLSRQFQLLGLSLSVDIKYTREGFVIPDGCSEILVLERLGLLTIQTWLTRHDDATKAEVANLVSLFWMKGKLYPRNVKMLASLERCRAFPLLMECIADITTDTNQLSTLTRVANETCVLRRIVYVIVKANKTLTADCYPEDVKICKRVRVLVMLRHGLACKRSAIATAKRSPLWEPHFLLSLLPAYVV